MHKSICELDKKYLMMENHLIELLSFIAYFESSICAMYSLQIISNIL